MNRILHFIVFIAGLVAIGWVALGYLGNNPLALAITLVIGAFYVMGALELRRFDAATASLSAALADAQTAPASLGDWLDRLHPSLRNAVRLRVEGERVGLPGPALAPYLTGLLVLLGMLGTFVGMVMTLSGTGNALESASDLFAIRASLAAPVKGLGLAFGTSLAGVAASAMLGLLAALCRRDRLQAAQLLDTRIATTLRAFSSAQRRDESFRLLQTQADAMPALMDRLNTLMGSIEQQSESLNARLIASHDGFHHKAEAAYAGLAASVGTTLQNSLSEGARIAATTIKPVVEATMSGIAREAAALHAGVGQATQRQLDALASGFDQRTAALVDGVAGRLDSTVDALSTHWRDALALHARTSEGTAADTQRALAAAAGTFEQHAAALLAGVGDAHARWHAQAAERDAAQRGDWSASLNALAAALDQNARDTAAATGTQAKETLTEINRLVDAAAEAPRIAAERDEARLAAWTASLTALAGSLEETTRAIAAASGAQAKTTMDEINRLVDAVAAAPRAQAAHDEARLAAWTASLTTLAGSLERTTRDLAAETSAQAQGTLAEINRLLQAAAQAPRAAAEVIGELRQKLTDGMARDNDMLQERCRVMATLNTLLDAVNLASGEQRTAIDALTAASADMLERTGLRFADRVDAEAGKLAAVSAQVTGSAVEVASLGESFGAAVQLFSESNERMGAQLQRIESALGQSLSRSDEQLAYYVAQARDVIDLSILSQKQIVEDLQQLARQRTAQSAA